MTFSCCDDKCIQYRAKHEIGWDIRQGTEAIINFASNLPHVYGRYSISCPCLALSIRPSDLLQFKIKIKSFADHSDRTA
jgi:hypothetical protein